MLERCFIPSSPVRSLEALHLASLAFLREHGKEVCLATYDGRMADAAGALAVDLEAV